MLLEHLDKTLNIDKFDFKKIELHNIIYFIYEYLDNVDI